MHWKHSGGNGEKAKHSFPLLPRNIKKKKNEGGRIGSPGRYFTWDSSECETLLKIFKSTTHHVNDHAHSGHRVTPQSHAHAAAELVKGAIGSLDTPGNLKQQQIINSESLTLFFDSLMFHYKDKFCFWHFPRKEFKRIFNFLEKNELIFDNI